MNTYNRNVKKELIKGWNTWNTRSVLSYVYMPLCFSVSMGIKEYRNGLFLREALIGRFEENSEKIFPIAHSYDGSYISLRIEWEDIVLSVETASDGDAFFAKVTPLKTQPYPPTLILEFYSLFDKNISSEKINRMIDEHFYNPEEFWGEYILPSISKNNPAYLDQNYWRGRIWAPLNFLVYLSMKEHNLTKPCRDICEKSLNLILKEWLEMGHVHENYSSLDGYGCGKENSDKFYHWGGLLSLIALMEHDYL